MAFAFASSGRSAGLGAGAAILAAGKTIWTSDIRPRSIAYLGPPLFDLDDLPRLAREKRASFMDVEACASTLAAGHVIGVVRGRQEFGQRALGHRSLLAFPSDSAVKQKLNAIKHRQETATYSCCCRRVFCFRSRSTGSRRGPCSLGESRSVARPIPKAQELAGCFGMQSYRPGAPDMCVCVCVCVCVDVYVCIYI